MGGGKKLIICAALKINKEDEEPIIVAGLRHGDCYETLYKLNKELSSYARRKDLIIDGFLTSVNTFVDRREAYFIAKQCGQISSQAQHDKTMRKEFELYSEDLY